MCMCGEYEWFRFVLLSVLRRQRVEWAAVRPPPRGQKMCQAWNNVNHRALVSVCVRRPYPRMCCAVRELSHRRLQVMDDEKLQGSIMRCVSALRSSCVRRGVHECDRECSPFDPLSWREGHGCPEPLAELTALAALRRTFLSKWQHLARPGD